VKNFVAHPFATFLTDCQTGNLPNVAFIDPKFLDEDTGTSRMVQAGVIVGDYCTVAVEMLKDNASPKAGALYCALDMPFAGLVGQLAGAFAKGR